MSRNSAAACAASLVLAEPQPASGPRRDGQPVVRDEPVGVAREQLAVHARLVVVALEARPGEPSRNRLCRPSASSASSVMCVYAPPPETSSSPPSAHRTRVSVEPAIGARREVGLHADDRLDPGRRRPACRSRRRRRRCRGRSSPAPASPAGRPRRTGRPAGPRRRASSTRCARAGARRSRWRPGTRREFRPPDRQNPAAGQTRRNPGRVGPRVSGCRCHRPCRPWSPSASTPWTLRFPAS